MLRINVRECARLAWPERTILAVLTLAACVSGCGTFGARNDELSFHGEQRGVEEYKGEETSIAHSNFHQPTPEDVQFAAEPRTIADRTVDDVRDVSLSEVIQVALMNNKIVQTGVQAPVGSKAIFTAGDNIASVYDQAIAETGVLFGRRGVEAALADFDTRLRTTMTWGRSRSPQNSLATLGATSIAETGNFTSALSKQFATGASISVFQNWNYLGSNSPGVLFPSSFSGNLGMQFRQPLLAGSGTDFTRIAGPVNPNFGAITGVSQGVLIARINSDISLAGFEASVRDSVRDLQKAYWDLYFAYHNYDAAVTAHRSAFQTWKEAKIKLDVGTLKAADEAQALEQFYATQATVESTLNALYKAETALRRLMGIQLNDGEILRPSDSPAIAEFRPDWRTCLAEALTRRVELRRQKWNVKSLQLQLQAARSLVRPQLDFVSGASMNGFGDTLISRDNDDPVSGRNLGSAYGTISDGRYPAWNLGFEYSVPIGFRSAISQVRNYEVRVAKARAVLAQQEREVAHDVTTAIQDLVANYTSAQTNRERLEAARRRVDLLELERIEGTTTLDLVLRAQTALAQAESQYYARVVDFNKALVDLEYAKGSLLPSTGIQLAEGGWDSAAYQDAMRRAMERTWAFENDHVDAATEPFASPVPVAPATVSPMSRPGAFAGPGLDEFAEPPAAPPEDALPADAPMPAADAAALSDDPPPGATAQATEPSAAADPARGADPAREPATPATPEPNVPQPAPAPPAAPKGAGFQLKYEWQPSAATSATRAVRPASHTQPASTPARPQDMWDLSPAAPRSRSGAERTEIPSGDTTATPDSKSPPPLTFDSLFRSTPPAR